MHPKKPRSLHFKALYFLQTRTRCELRFARRFRVLSGPLCCFSPRLHHLQPQRRSPPARSLRPGDSRQASKPRWHQMFGFLPAGNQTPFFLKQKQRFWVFLCLKKRLPFLERRLTFVSFLVFLFFFFAFFFSWGFFPPPVFSKSALWYVEM